MSEFDIVGKQVGRMYDLPSHGVSYLKVEAIDFHPKTESWSYCPSYIDDDPIHPYKDEVERQAKFYGKDITECIVTLINKDNEKYRKYASLVRAVRPSMNLDKLETTWKTSCIIRHKTGISIGRNGRKNKVRRHRSNHDMLWELAGPEPITLLDNLERLANEAYRLFEDRMQNAI